MTFLQQMAGGKPIGTPQVLVQNGGFHDGLSTNRRYVATGYTKLIMRDITSSAPDAQRQLFLPPLNGKDSSGSTQVCNVSISQDTAYSSRCLFLDFGSTTVSTLTQSTYGIHEYLFVADFSGRTIAWFKCPTGESSWNYPKWSNAPVFAVASGCNSGQDAHAIYLVNLQNGNYQQVAQGTELEHPCLWLGEIIRFPQNLSADSLGAYDVPDQSLSQEQFAGKMHLFWKMHRTLNVAFIGGSQVENGIDCKQITGGLVAANLAITGSEVQTWAHLLPEYIIPNSPDLKVVAISATPYWLADSGGENTNVWTPGIVQSEGYQYDKSHNFWGSGLPDQFDSLMQITNAYSIPGFDSLGWGPPPCYGWQTISVMGGRTDWTVDNPVYISNFNIIARWVTELSAMHIHFIMINFPENPTVANTGYYLSYGPSKATGEAVMQQFKSLGANNPYFHFFDQWLDGNHDYDSLEFLNINHLCAAGAEKISARLDSLIHTFLP